MLSLVDREKRRRRKKKYKKNLVSESKQQTAGEMFEAFVIYLHGLFSNFQMRWTEPSYML